MRRVVVALLLVLVPLAKASSRLPVQVALSVTDLHSGRAILPDGRLVSTGDGFLHWGASFRLTVPVHDLSAFDRYTAFVVDTGGVLHRTQNGGSSWSTMTNAPRLDRIVAAGAERLYATTWTGQLTTSADGGTTWLSRPLKGIRSLCAPDAGDLLVSRQGAILRSTDSGRSFTTEFRIRVARIAKVPIELTCAHGGVWGTVDGIGGAANQQAYVLLESPDGGRHWLPRLGEHFFQYWRAADRTANGPPSVPVVAPTGRSGAVIAGGCEACGIGLTTVMITHDGGRTWSGSWQGGVPGDVPPVLDNADPLAIDFVDARHGWLIVQDFRTSPRILRTSDGGRTWAFLVDL